MNLRKILDWIFEHYIISTVAIVFIVILIINGCNGFSKSGLKKYSYYEVDLTIEEIVNTGVGHEFKYRLKINNENVLMEEFPYIKRAENLKCEFVLIEDDLYDDTATHTCTLNSYKTDSTTFYITIYENGGYSNSGTYAKFKVTIKLTGKDNPYGYDYDYDYDYNW